jgi:hypothetical protein
MSRYVFIYHRPAWSAEAPAPTPEESKAGMARWMAWHNRVGDGMVDFGTPLADGVRVSSEGTAASDRDVVGYSIVEADSMDEALALAAGHPHLDTTAGCEIEVHAALPLPSL